MTLPTGNKNKAFTFVEVMVTLVILSAGIIFIYKSFFVCVDYLSRLTIRLHAHELLNAKMGDVYRVFHETSDITAVIGPSVIFENIDHKTIDFACQVLAEPVPSNDGAYRVMVILSWREANRPMKILRSTILAV